MARAISRGNGGACRAGSSRLHVSITFQDVLRRRAGSAFVNAAHSVSMSVLGRPSSNISTKNSAKTQSALSSLSALQVTPRASMA